MEDKTEDGSNGSTNVLNVVRSLLLTALFMTTVVGMVWLTK